MGQTLLRMKKETTKKTSLPHHILTIQKTEAPLQPWQHKKGGALPPQIISPWARCD